MTATGCFAPVICLITNRLYIYILWVGMLCKRSQSKEKQRFRALFSGALLVSLVFLQLFPFKLSLVFGALGWLKNKQSNVR